MRSLRIKRISTNGFTLIEMIASIVIIGILAALVSIGVASIFEGYIFTKKNADTAMRAQIALTRLMKEFSSIDGVYSGTKTSITYSYYNEDGTSIPYPYRTVSWSGTPNAPAPLLLGGNTLAENVSDFELKYYTSYNDAGDNLWEISESEKIIGITLKIIGASDVVSSFSTRVIPRNL
jgi:prepilin-type N-terminal cleavage/methylation domain-containing protein